MKKKDNASSGKVAKVLIVPYDIRIPKIRIGTRQARELEGHRVVVRVDSWDEGSRYPTGHLVRSIGRAGELETETATIMIEYQLSRSSFSRALLNGEENVCVSAVGCFSNTERRVLL